MQYPLISEYVRAIQDASNNLDELAHLVPVQDDHGEPYRSSGAFAVVFKMKDEQTGKCYALKCFTEEQEGRAEAYRQIADELEFVDSSYITSVKYLDKEIFVDSSCEEDEFPVLLMDWIDGETMETYIAENYQDNYTMAMLCYRFCKMAAWLRSQPFAHGDIKPDNIMVRPDGSLTLVDYDGMFVPAMKGQKSPTIGTKDFSHPLRTVDDFNETIDDFALASIALSLKAISLKPSLLDEYGAADRLLFSAEDYRDLSKSKVLAALQELMNDEEVNTLLSLFLLAKTKKNLVMCSLRLLEVSKPIISQEYNIMLQEADKIINLSTGDKEKAVEIYKKFAAQGNMYAIAGLGVCYCYAKGVECDIKKGIELIKKAIKAGNPKGYNVMGGCYKWGVGVERNLEKSVEYFLISAKLGFAAGQYNLGDAFLTGKGISKDYKKSVLWLEKAIKQDYATAFGLLGKCYREGKGVAKNLIKGFELTKIAASQGDVQFQYELGICYYNGCGTKQNYKQAVYWYQISANQGYANAQFSLGLCYANGIGIEKKCKEAVYWYRKSAEQGNASAQNNLGVCYKYGNGCEKSLELAVDLFLKSSEQGNIKAFCNLAICYEEGTGVEKNLKTAIAYYRKAANQGDKFAEEKLMKLEQNK
uniref:protein kinase domain-containing protein n=1 Tax=Segatella copri TaxID=165179 RepID=UPI0040279917